MVTGLKNPESVCVGPGPDGKVFVTAIGEFDKDGDGAVMVIEPAARPMPFVTGLDDPKGIASSSDWLFVADKTKVLRDRRDAKSEGRGVRRRRQAFPVPPMFLNDIAVDPRAARSTSATPATRGKGGAVYRINPKGGAVTLVVDEKKLPGLNTPNGLRERRHVAPAARRLRHRRSCTA